MLLNEFNFSLDDYIKGIVTVPGDIYKVNQNGFPRSFRDIYGEKPLVRVPDRIPTKYKGCRITSLNVICNACELVTGIEAHYGRPGAGGYALSFDSELTQKDVTNYYKGGCK